MCSTSVGINKSGVDVASTPSKPERTKFCLPIFRSAIWALLVSVISLLYFRMLFIDVSDMWQVQGEGSLGSASDSQLLQYHPH